MARSSKKTQKYHIALPVDLHQKIKEIAEERGLDMSEVIRRSLDLGIIAHGIVGTEYPRLVDISAHGRDDTKVTVPL